MCLIYLKNERMLNSLKKEKNKLLEKFENLLNIFK